MSGGGGGGGDWRPDPKPPVPPKPAPGSKGSGGGGTGGTGGNPCQITEITNLNSVNSTVLSRVRRGDILNVTHLAGPPVRLVAQTSSGDTVGSITSPSMPQLILCMTQQGYQYIAEVLAIRGGICEVEIRAR